MKEWRCRKCGQVVISNDRPEPIKWTDGHVCIFYEWKNDD